MQRRLTRIVPSSQLTGQKPVHLLSSRPFASLCGHSLCTRNSSTKIILVPLCLVLRDEYKPIVGLISGYRTHASSLEIT